ncbi:MAG: hypothetical protein E7169_04295 [Firmicutes bacterium]|nr:hypothetical protein [Bacillota bacterium]
MNNYLIPANSKKSMLIFGLFNQVDLIIFCSGAGATLLLLLILPVEQLLTAIIAITPGLVCGFLVLPIPNYHNVRTVIKSAYTFFTSRQKFIWKGWCFLDGKDEK